MDLTLGTHVRGELPHPGFAAIFLSTEHMCEADPLPRAPSQVTAAEERQSTSEHVTIQGCNTTASPASICFSLPMSRPLFGFFSLPAGASSGLSYRLHSRQLLNLLNTSMVRLEATLHQLPPKAGCSHGRASTSEFQGSHQIPP